MKVQVGAKTAKKRKRFRMNDDYKWGYIFISVAMAVFLVFTVYPLISAFLISFQKFKPLGSEWVGLENYKALLKDELFFKSIVNTTIYTIGAVPVNLFISFGIALLMFPLSKKLQTMFKAIYYLPSVASGVTMSLVWLWIFDPLPAGLLNRLVALFGIPNQNWLGSTKTAMLSLLLMTWLGNHGKSIIIYVAALGGIPDSLFEVADIEGASFLKKVRYIIFPLLKPTTLFLTVTGVIGSFQVFMNAYLMTSGGPNNATTMIGLLIFRNAFTYFNFGVASAQALVLTLIIVVISVLQFKYFGEDVEY
ncbi:spermidine/putrescine ABC transporter permease [Clostridium thermosuccinogenes]|jgi:multiple sugar transport system permease protein|uniref:Spermidine/putrescine ABC transporter permease n=1 Tax=Clostridium thermosuccinogenes TaxID=84032 RepID=A0A2K2F0G5_9CLOT|nr:sugar ABC transporter permease [Pseudoclostridium thermosuccinogenes]AUS97058.1 spermidine/putrescine ABC transporter permease [Pseudoclostridium thermosuccinogenes]PNT92275.1 spermidine/putrescine ABC transporter permease [Pseudoclostridium thermosuccinogenes]PNT96669.1 spermidine/putrescine ABC transporter permease [Pseudoclostridium thermosuccinogenes]PNT98462.1 spermidine/putrescine ABC transporter permease [Pseudoclostridium thermosuccinogenes]